MHYPARTHACVLLASVAIALVPAPSLADIVWNITFNDVENGTNVGFDDPTFGAARRTTFTAVTDYLNTVLDETGTVDFLVNNSTVIGPQPFPNPSPALASAGSLYFTGPNGTSNGLVFEHATTGADPNPGPSGFEGSAQFDFGYNYNSEMDAPTGSEFDLFSISLHEITHALGFASLINPNGTSGISDGNPGVFSVFDDFLIRGTPPDGTNDIVTAAGNFVGTLSDLISNDLFFNGLNAIAANGGSPVRGFSPSPFQPGSSLSHIVQGDAVMQFSIPPGMQRRQYTPQDLAILQDLGWSVITPVAVPEPSSAILLGLVALSGAAWRKRRAFSVPSGA